MDFESKLESFTTQIDACWQRIISILASTKNVINNNVACQQLKTVPPNEREGYISQMWGHPALEKCKVLVDQLAFLEREKEKVTI